MLLDLIAIRASQKRRRLGNKDRWASILLLDAESAHGVRNTLVSEVLLVSCAPAA
jgi:hypothetical protein